MPNGWDIEPGGVATVVTKVGGYVTGDGGLVKELDNFSTHMGNAATASASAPINTALKELAGYVSPGLKGMVTKTGSCITGAVNATKAYIQGDLEMAAEAQRNAVSAPAPKIGK